MEKWPDEIAYWLGERIGAGKARTVYHHRFNPKWVVKICRDVENRNENLVEAQVWAALKDREEGLWLAPVIACAEDGSWLVMAKAKPITHNSPHSGLKKRVQHKWLADVTGHRNWGLLDGRVVVVDYGYLTTPKKIQAYLGIDVANTAGQSPLQQCSQASADHVQSASRPAQ